MGLVYSQRSDAQSVRIMLSGYPSASRFPSVQLKPSRLVSLAFASARHLACVHAYPSSLWPRLAPPALPCQVFCSVAPLARRRTLPTNLSPLTRYVLAEAHKTEHVAFRDIILICHNVGVVFLAHGSASSVDTLQNTQQVSKERGTLPVVSSLGLLPPRYC